MNDKLSKRKYWNNNYSNNVFLPVKIDPSGVDIFSLNELFKKHLLLDEGDNFIELGCAPGGWMYYFNRYFNLNVSGIDYAEIGIRITQENMDMLKIKAPIFTGDIFQYCSKEKYKVVFSAGLIEHFYGEKLNKIMKKHFDLAKIGGYVVMIIPNLNGWNYFYQKLINKKNLDIHNLEMMNLNFFKNNISEDIVEEIFLGYAGKINFGLYSGNKFFGYLHTALQYLINVLFFKLGIKFKDNKRTSPYIVAIFKVIGR